MSRKTSKLSRPIRSILIIYMICYLFRVAEYLYLRTDQGIFGEAFIHKLVGILVLLFVLRYYSATWRDIGFQKNHAGKYIIYGLLLGIIVFIAAYGIEAFLCIRSGQRPALELYVSSYTIKGNKGNQTELLFFAFCLIGNVINVFMEEGVFRGVFLKLGEKKYSFLKAVLLSSLLFGIWHLMAPVRSFLDGEMDDIGIMMSALFLVLPSILMGIKLCMLTKITGSLWMPMADHFLNNTIVNVLHIVTASGADEWMVLRISIAQSLSFFIVLFLFWRTKARRKSTFR